MKIYVSFKKLIAVTRLKKNGKNSAWRGDSFFADGTLHSKGTLILIKQGLDFNAVERHTKTIKGIL